MKKEEHFFLGYISRKHGYKGAFNIKLEAAATYEEVDYLFIKINGSFVPFFIDSFGLKKREIALVKLEDVKTEQEAKELIGKEVSLPLKHQKKKSAKRTQIPNWLFSYRSKTWEYWCSC